MKVKLDETSERQKEGEKKTVKCCEQLIGCVDVMPLEHEFEDCIIDESRTKTFCF